MKNRQVTRLEKVIDELIKIQDDGKGTDGVARMLELANHEIIVQENGEKR